MVLSLCGGVGHTRLNCFKLQALNQGSRVLCCGTRVSTTRVWLGLHGNKNTKDDFICHFHFSLSLTRTHSHSPSHPNIQTPNPHSIGDKRLLLVTSHSALSLSHTKVSFLVLGLCLSFETLMDSKLEILNK